MVGGQRRVVQPAPGHQRWGRALGLTVQESLLTNELGNVLGWGDDGWGCAREGTVSPSDHSAPPSDVRHSPSTEKEKLTLTWPTWLVAIHWYIPPMSLVRGVGGVHTPDSPTIPP